eukprot:gene8175-10398_t
MARGTQGGAGHQGCAHSLDATAQEMTKWFDTNYHYMVPELEAGQVFRLSSTRLVDEFREAKALGYHTRPVLLGPVSYLMLAKGRGVEPLSLLPALLPVYAEILTALADAGADWVQVDEPCLVLDLDHAQHAAFADAYARLAGAGVKLMLTTYFGGLGANLGLVAGLPVDGLHIDLVRAPEQLGAICARVPKSVAGALAGTDAALDDSAWPVLRMPQAWESQGLPGAGQAQL